MSQNGITSPVDHAYGSLGNDAKDRLNSLPKTNKGHGLSLASRGSDAKANQIDM